MEEWRRVIVNKDRNRRQIHAIKLYNLTIGVCNGAGGLFGAADGDFLGGWKGGGEERRQI